ncbi:MAG: hypothetical protein LBV69_07855 [Bacteroidales bacterium]|jgi:hypothetical protein|nr:hypothetical protein [Bacteroidales bacterium]
MKTYTKIALIFTIILISFGSVSARMSRRSVNDFINKTSYVINEAYDMVYYYNYYTSGNLSKAVDYQRYAKYLYNTGRYDNSIYYSSVARDYALKVIYYCDNYWNNYYRPYNYGYYYNNHYYGGNYYYGRGDWNYNNNYHNNNYHNNNYGYNNNGHNNGYNNNGYNNNRRNGGTGRDGNNNSGNRSRKNETTNTNTNRSVGNSKFLSTGEGENATVNVNDFDNWSRSYYTSDELSSIKGLSTISATEMDRAISSSNITRTTDDSKIDRNTIKDFSADITAYTKEHAEEARTITISRPTDFGTTEEVTRSSAGKEIFSTENNTRKAPVETERTPTVAPREITPNNNRTVTPTENNNRTVTPRETERTPAVTPNNNRIVTPTENVKTPTVTPNNTNRENSNSSKDVKSSSNNSNSSASSPNSRSNNSSSSNSNSSSSNRNRR